DSIPMTTRPGDAVRAPDQVDLDAARAQLGLEDRALLELGQALQDCGYRFTTISPASHERVMQRPGQRFARDLRDVFGWSRPFRDDLLPTAMLSLLRSAAALKPVASGWCSTVRFSTLRCGNRDELFVHSAYPTQATDAVFFGPDTYRFVRAIRGALAEHAPVQRALDLGCGAGAGA